MSRPQEIHSEFEQAFNAGDLEKLVALYQPAATLNVQAGGPVTGHQAIREAYKSVLTSRPAITLTTVAVFEGGELALLHGSWILHDTDPQGSKIRLQGRNTEVVRRQPGGNWLFLIDNPFTPDSDEGQ
jgi:uncharacterized protein (TIGR02246 family)